jgi:DNA-binding CsgD family transcriptional regulator
MGKHLLIAYLAASLALGTASTAILAAALRRSRDGSLRLYLAFCSCLVLMLVKVMAIDYIGVNVSARLGPAEVGLLFFAPIPVSFLMLGLLPPLAHGLAKPAWRRSGNAIAGAATTALGAIALTPLYASYSPREERITFGPAFAPVNALLFSIALYSIVLVLSSYRRLEKERRRPIGPALAVFILFSPGIAYDLLQRPGGEGLGALPFLPAFFPLFFMVLSAGNIAYGMRYLIASANRASPNELPLAAPPESLATRIEALRASASLSPREAEVASLIASGLGNKQIARELGISAKTADNHVYNLYKKLGIGSRYELISRLSLDSEPWV